MPDWSQTVIQQLAATSALEWVAATLAIAYLLLAVKQNIACWVAAFFSTLIYTIIFFDVKLYMESLLNIYYLLMAVYGYWQWRDPRFLQREQGRPIVLWSLQRHFAIMVGTLIIVSLNGCLLSATDAAFPYLDSFTTWFAVITTVMVAKKELTNWLYWIVIDLISIYLYWQKGLLLTALIFVVYVVIAAYGFVNWWRDYLQSREQRLQYATR